MYTVHSSEQNYTTSELPASKSESTTHVAPVASPVTQRVYNRAFVVLYTTTLCIARVGKPGARDAT